MTNDEAIRYLGYLRENYTRENSQTCEAVDMAIAALEPKMIHTNADKIRQMTDEELAAFFNKKTLGLTSVCDVPCEIYDVTGHCFVSECYDAFLKWLKHEADE